MNELLRHFRDDEGGADAIEYGLLASLLVLAAMAAFINFSNAAGAMWANLATHI